jgi:UDP-glucose 4-epimerase
MKVLITGGAGYVGTVLTKNLVSIPEVEKIIVYDNLSRKNSNLFLGERLPNAEKIELIVGDILDLRRLKKVLDGVDVVFHLAARVSTPFANIDADFHEQVNHWGTAELVSAVEESEVKKFIFTSSTSVYGASDDFIQETELPDPKTFYGISKFRGEEHVQRLQKKRNAIILRCANVYGYSRSMRFDAVINRFMFDANFTRRIQIHGNGKQYRAFIHVNTLIKSLIGCMLNDVPSGTYNVIDKNIQILDIVDVLKEIYPSLEFIFINQHLDLRQMKVDRNSKIREYVDFENDQTLMEELLDFKKRFAF